MAQLDGAQLPVIFSRFLIVNHGYDTEVLADSRARIAGVLLVLAFFIVYFFRSFALSGKLRRFTRSLEPLRNKGAGPREIEASDQHLHHLWGQYCETLHAEKSFDENGLETTRRYRATLPASAIFYSGSVIDGRLSIEFFKHLPGLLTGLGIIGTFSGLISGLRNASIGGGLDTQVLISSVGEAFIFSAARNHRRHGGDVLREMAICAPSPSN